MSPNRQINAFHAEDKVASPVGQGQGQGVSKPAKACRRKTAKKAKCLDADVAKSGYNSVIGEKMQRVRRPRKPRQKPGYSARGKDGTLNRSMENNAQLDVKPGMPKALLLSLESSMPSQTPSHSEGNTTYQVSPSYPTKLITLPTSTTPSIPVSLDSTVSTPQATSDPPCPDYSSTALPESDSSSIVDQCYDNLLEMIRLQRQALLTGPQITIRIGDTSVTGIYKRSAMAASSVLHRHFTRHPESLEYRFSRGQIHPGPVRLLLVEWMHKTCNEFEAHAVPGQSSFGDDVAVLRAARLLGMERYCTHTLKAYVSYLKTKLPSYQEIVVIEQNATSSKDPLWTAMVNHLCYQRFKGLIPDPEEFEKFLEKHRHLKQAMEVADAFFAGYAKKRAAIRNNERQKRWQQNEAEQHEHIVREKRATASLKKKLDVTGSGLITVTADEAEVLRGRIHSR